MNDKDDFPYIAQGPETEKFALEEDLLLLKAAFDSLPDRIAVLDGNGSTILVNRAWQQFVDENTPSKFCEHCLEQKYFPICQSDSTKKVHEGIKTVIEGEKQNFNFKYSCHSKNGQQWFYMNVSRLPAVKKGAVIRHENISDNVKTSEDLELYRLMIEKTSDAIYLINAEKDYKMEYVNEAALKHFGASREEILTWKVPDWNPSFTTEDVTNLINYLKKFKQYENDHIVETLHKVKQGEIIPVEVSINFINYKKHECIFGYIKDISERKRTEKELKESQQLFYAVFDNAGVGIAQTALDGRFLLVNREVCNILGYSKEDFLQGNLNFQQLTHPDDLANDLAHAKELMRGDKERYHIEKRYIRKDGKMIWGNLTVQLVRNDAGKPLYLIKAVEDFTPRKQLESDLYQAKQEAEQANQAKSYFLANISHEIRTPLNAILGFSSLMLQDANISNNQRENLRIINHSGEHLLNLINDVLDMAKIESGRTMIETRTIDLVSMLTNTMNMMRIKAEEKNLTLLLDFPDILHHFIKIDADKLKQILINLVSNAIKYTKKGGISVRTMIKTQQQPTLMVCIEDSGIGIEKSDLTHIFDPFVQIGGIQTENKGTGLGLAIVQQYMTLMKGTIEVESEPGIGSIFRLKIPIQLATESDLPHPEVVKGKIIGIELGQPDYRMLIVEDQEENWLLLSQLLTEVGFVVELAKDGREAIEAFLSFKPDVIWMDRRMPNMDGIEATRQIRALEDGKEVKIIAVTASAFSSERDEMLDSGMDDFIRKPYRISEIFDCLTKHFGLRFIYEEPKIEENFANTPIDFKMLECLEPHVRQELSDALILGNMDNLLSITKQISQQYPDFAQMLQSHIEAFDYLSILNALDSMNKNNK